MHVVYGATAAESLARLHHQTVLSVTAAYQNLSSVPIDKQATLFSTPHPLRLSQSTPDLLQSLLQQYCSGQEQLILMV
jgi:hypothetical protein